MAGVVPTDADQSDMMICSGEKPVGYLVMSGKSKHKMYTSNGGSYSALTGSCSCSSLFTRTSSDFSDILTCNTKPNINLLAGGVLPFCWRGYSDDAASGTAIDSASCPKLRKPMPASADSVQAQLCYGGNQVGILYDNQDMLPASGKSEDTIQGCECTSRTTSPYKDGISYLKCQNTTPRLPGVKDPNKIVCVNPLVSCSVA
ncbi:hypothetical protein PtB15_18B85 [Puccinia triticina]|nr:hypothetical protein PtB15_18B85 [Puccinia triticina]